MGNWGGDLNQDSWNKRMDQDYTGMASRLVEEYCISRKDIEPGVESTVIEAENPLSLRIRGWTKIWEGTRIHGIGGWVKIYSDSHAERDSAQDC